MRILFVAPAVVLLGTACVSSGPRERYGRSYEGQQIQPFDAYTTDGSYVRVQQDPRTGDLFVTDPPSLSGERVVMINQDTSSGIPLVEARSGPDYRRPAAASGADRDGRRGSDRDDDHGSDREHR